ncbi:hypothetical protein SPI_07115 [Niveomyces insectorum RCEF 264]|uniref:AT hook domain-containing protein n=1 Tax=Niveomyces insectorum RCEF 264 TaxID=1081102 RepID=A0A167QAG1_9HYPO|nr:hypothetical protein SPI_07115 [Niveomyces insectorum RCEF 264]
MAPPRCVVYDSDEEDSELSSLASPIAPPAPALSPSPRPPRPSPTKAPDTSTSTDPAFFCSVYEDQQRTNVPSNANTRRSVSAEKPGAATSQDPRPSAPSRDDHVWEVPISPQPASPRRRDNAKRKRDDGAPCLWTADVDEQAEDAQHGPTAKKPRNEDAPPSETSRTVLRRSHGPEYDDNDNATILGGAGASHNKTGRGEKDSFFSTSIESTTGSLHHPSGGFSGAVEISIPLAPMTPNTMRQYRVFASSRSDGLVDGDGYGDGDGDGDTRLRADDGPLQQTPQRHPASEAITESTIAYTTPSIYAASGRCSEVHSSVHNATGEPGAGEADSDHVVHRTTPARRDRGAEQASLDLLSSPDILAEAAAPRPQLGRKAFQAFLKEKLKKTSDDGREKVASSTSRRKKGNVTTGDELSADRLDRVSQDDAEWDPSPAAAAPSARKNQPKRPATSSHRRKSQSNDGEDTDTGNEDRAVLCVADSSEDEGGALSPAESACAKEEEEEEEEDRPPRKRGRRKKETKGRATAAGDEAATPAKTPTTAGKPRRGRPKKQKANAPNELSKEVDAASPAAKSEAAEAPTHDVAAESVTDAAKRAGTDDADKPALRETSGNAAAISVSAGTVDHQKAGASITTDDTKTDDTKADDTKGSGRATAKLAAASGSLSSSQGRVPFRVGLSKKLRIAPLLKSMRR